LEDGYYRYHRGVKNKGNRAKGGTKRTREDEPKEEQESEGTREEKKKEKEGLLRELMKMRKLAVRGRLG
jgi:hypothetical protein